MKIIVMFILLTSVGKVSACFAPPESWHMNDEALISNTKNILIAKFSGKEFKVLIPLKGNYKTGSNFKIPSTVEGNNSLNSVEINPDCTLSTSFIKGHTYVIFLNAIHPKGYNEYAGASDGWVKTINSSIKELDSKRKKR